MRTFKADLHIHTCLSACADLDMTPPKIIKKAMEKGLHIIAITDHNSAENLPAFRNLPKGLTVLAGMEITTAEEVHLLALFGSYEEIEPLQEIVYNSLQGPEFDGGFGYQLIVNEREEILSFSKRPLVSATGMSTAQLIKQIKALNGLVIASHIDKEVFSIISQLGFILEEKELDAVEISVHTAYEEAKKRFSGINFPIVRSSDSHHLHEIGRAFTEFLIEAPTIEEIKKALRREGGRKIS